MIQRNILHLEADQDSLVEENGLPGALALLPCLLQAVSVTFNFLAKLTRKSAPHPTVLFPGLPLFFPYPTINPQTHRSPATPPASPMDVLQDPTPTHIHRAPRTPSMAPPPSMHLPPGPTLGRPEPTPGQNRGACARPAARLEEWSWECDLCQPVSLNGCSCAAGPWEIKHYRTSGSVPSEFWELEFHRFGSVLETLIERREGIVGRNWRCALR